MQGDSRLSLKDIMTVMLFIPFLRDFPCLL
jgi:hypothetical protein